MRAGRYKSYRSPHAEVAAFRFEVGGFLPIKRTKLEDEKPNHVTSSQTTQYCTSMTKKVQDDVRFYASLRDRFRLRGTVDDFVRKYFHPAPYTIGIHLRAGNNESGHFVSQGRTIDNVTSWTHQVVQLIQTLLQQEMNHRIADHRGRPVLFIATDTPSMISSFHSLFSNDTLSIVSLPQRLMNEGQGVMFGEHGSPTPVGDECLRGWEATLTEMMVLSHVDTLLVPRLSSFSQTLPVSLAFAQRQAKMNELPESNQNGNPGRDVFIPTPPVAYCELN